MTYGVSLRDALLPNPSKKKLTIDDVTKIALGIVVGATFVTTVNMCHKPPQPISRPCSECHNKFTTYFKGSKSPELMAQAVLKTRNPRLLAAIHVGGEKRTPHTARNTGYKGRYSGPWSTSEHWGKITKDTTIIDMALMAELALETHTAEEKDIIRGLNAYGGESDKVEGEYAYNVLVELERVPAKP